MDIWIKNFSLLFDAADIHPGSVLPFALELAVTGHPIGPTRGFGNTAPFIISFVLARSDMPAVSDLDLGYEMASDIAAILRNGFGPDQSAATRDTHGMVVMITEGIRLAWMRMGHWEKTVQLTKDKSIRVHKYYVQVP